MADKCCEKEIRISFCPACKSRDIRYVFGVGNLFGIIPQVKCLECGFKSMSFPVLITTEEKLKTSVKNMKEKINSKKKKIIRRKK
jgi:Zn ribbon nucleic-acid-binding protein